MSVQTFSSCATTASYADIMYAADGIISGSASMRVETRSLLRLAGQLACAVQNTSNCSAVIVARACSTLKGHVQCAQGMCSLELYIYASVGGAPEAYGSRRVCL